MPSLLDRFRGLRVLVVGDLIADRYLRAEPVRLSREAPVMVLRHRSESLSPGGAANVALNLRAIGCEVTLVGVVGRDAEGRELLTALREAGVQVDDVLVLPSRVTTTKTRILAAEPRRSAHQVLRIDREPEEELTAQEELEVCRRVREHTGKNAALLLSDYEYGVVGTQVSELARVNATSVEQITVLDPRRDVERFRGLTALTPNVGELARFTGVDADKLDDSKVLAAAAVQLRARLGLKHLLVTRGNLGAVLFDDGAPDGLWVEASGTGDVTDVSGAGDTVAALFTAALAAGAPAPEALVCANAAAGVVVMESGAVACSLEALSKALEEAPWPSGTPKPSPRPKDVEA